MTGSHLLPNLALPHDFPLASYLRTRDRVLAGRRMGEREEEFVGAWLAVAHRYLELARSESALSELLRTDLDPTPSFDLDREFFAFFTSGAAVLEGFCYGMFAVGALLRPDDFPLTTPTDRRNATLGATLRLYSQAFQNDAITRALFWWLNSREFGWWKEVAGILARRCVPGYDPSRPNPGPRPTDTSWRLRGQPVYLGLAADKRAWLAGALAELMSEADHFTRDRLSTHS